MNAIMNAIMNAKMTQKTSWRKRTLPLWAVLLIVALIAVPLVAAVVYFATFTLQNQMMVGVSGTLDLAYADKFNLNPPTTWAGGGDIGSATPPAAWIPVTDSETTVDWGGFTQSGANASKTLAVKATNNGNAPVKIAWQQPTAMPTGWTLTAQAYTQGSPYASSQGALAKGAVSSFTLHPGSWTILVFTLTANGQAQTGQVQSFGFYIEGNSVN
jgi:hypothetical protein